ncbi:MAG: hypothetical protein R2706_02790 [Acidimicrobiales bacterium]
MSQRHKAVVRKDLDLAGVTVDNAFELAYLELGVPALDDTPSAIRAAEVGVGRATQSLGRSAVLGSDASRANGAPQGRPDRNRCCTS